MDFSEYIKPELLTLVPALYILGKIIKDTDKINDKFIPSILGGCGVVLSSLYVMATSGINMMSIFTAITQGLLVTGASVYVNQLLVQSKK